MIECAEATPVTYLDQGKTYFMSVLDTTVKRGESPQPKYRTVIQVSSELERPKEGDKEDPSSRRLRERDETASLAHAGSSELFAIEYVHRGPNGGGGYSPPQVELEHASFDRFSLTWASSLITGGSYCLIPIRLNFLETDLGRPEDFTGKSIELSARTEIILSNNASLPSAGNHEECFVRIKLFMERGAERKLSEDVANVKETVGELQESIRRLSLETGNPRKRKSTGSRTQASPSQHDRGVGYKKLSPTTNVGEGVHKDQEAQNLRGKLLSTQNMLSSIRPVSVLNHKTANEIPPKSFRAPFEQTKDLEGPVKRIVSASGTRKNEKAPISSTRHSISSLTTRITDNGRPTELSHIVVPKIPHDNPLDTHRKQIVEAVSSTKSTRRLPPHDFNATTISVALTQDDSVPTSQLPLATSAKSVVCFYVRLKDATDIYHRAIYLTERTMPSLLSGISDKYKVETSRVRQVTYFDSRAMEIIVDQDVISRLDDGQDIIVELASTNNRLSHTMGNPVPPINCDAGILTPPTSISSIPALGEDLSYGFDEFVDYGIDVFQEEHYIFEDLPEQEWLGYLEPWERTNLFMNHSNSVDKEMNDGSSYSGVRTISWSPAGDTSVPLTEETGQSVMAISEYSVEPETFKAPYKLEDELTPAGEDGDDGTGGDSASASARTLQPPSKVKIKAKTDAKADARSTASAAASASRRERMSRSAALEKNRLAAARCRQGRSENEARLRAESQEKLLENTLLRRKILEMKAQVQTMAALLSAHNDCP